MKGIRAGCAMTGSFCTFTKAFEAWRTLKNAGAEILPIMSENAYNTDTRFYAAKDARGIFSEIADQEIIHTIDRAEPIGPKKLTDIMIVSPCTGNTLSKIANGIVDTPVALAVKSTLRNGKPVLIAVSSNDALGIGAKNLGLLLGMRNIFFVPFAQDDPAGKPQSLVAKFDMLVPSVYAALSGIQLQPILAV
ncbi:MAG: dipicolinate synthase subunit B [Clostridia bacterium]|nr:dipicolinate synthase subunit B [Clostridia bacterium]